MRLDSGCSQISSSTNKFLLRPIVSQMGWAAGLGRGQTQGTLSSHRAAQHPPLETLLGLASETSLPCSPLLCSVCVTSRAKEGPSSECPGCLKAAQDEGWRGSHWRGSWTSLRPHLPLLIRRRRHGPPPGSPSAHPPSVLWAPSPHSWPGACPLGRSGFLYRCQRSSTC